MSKLNLIPILACGLMLPACFGIDPENFTELSPLQVVVASDTLNANIGEPFHYTGLTVRSDKPVTYQWSFGSPKASTTVEQHQFASRTILDTDSPTLDWTFTQLGSYILRLRVDNGESIVHHFFRLNVNSGFDEGVAILDNAADGASSLTFIKTLTAEEKEQGEEPIVTLYPDAGLRNGVQLFMSNERLSGIGEQAALVIATADEEGTVYLFNPKTLELIAKDNMASFGTVCREIGGEYARVHDMGCFMTGEDGRVYRFDMLIGYLTEIPDFPEGITRAYGAVNRTWETSASTISPFFFGKDFLATRSTASSGIKTFREDGYDVVNIAASRTMNTYPVFTLLRSRTDSRRYRILRANLSSGGQGTWYTDNMGERYQVDFTADDLRMDGNSHMIGTKRSSDVYYDYNNAIYRWSLTSPPATRPAITLPAGEQIRDMAVNFLGKAATPAGAVDAGEDLLYVLTWNPSRAGDKKGSLYVYRFSDDTLVASYEGICNDPVSVIYKYRLS